MRITLFASIVVVLSVGCGATGEVDGELYPAGESSGQGGAAGSGASGEGTAGNSGGFGPHFEVVEGGGWSRTPGLGGFSRDSGATDADGGTAGSSADGGSPADGSGAGECAVHSDCGDFRACVNGICVSCDGIYLPEACEPDVQLVCPEDKLLICHHPYGSDENSHEICVSQKAWLMAHSKHDKDLLGSCD